MDLEGEKQVSGAAENIYSGLTLALFRGLVGFVGNRRQSAEAARGRVLNALPAGSEPGMIRRELHAMLSECWDALDGLGRLVSVCLYPRFPDAGLSSPHAMTRQCTFYTVRRDLHRHPRARQHPLTRLLWETRSSPHPAYERLSFLYNLSCFLPVPILASAELPGWVDLSEDVRSLVRCQDVAKCPLVSGMNEILSWQEDLIGACYDEITVELKRQRKEEPA